MPIEQTQTPWILQFASGSARKIPPHRNAGIEIVYVEGGHLPWQVENRSDPVGPGSVFFTLPWQWHGSTADFEPGHSWHYFILRVEGKGIDRPGPLRLPKAIGFSGAEQRQLFATLRSASRHTWPGSETLAESMRCLIRECGQPGQFHERCCAAWVAIILTELERTIRENEMIVPLPGADCISQLVDELSRRLDERWTLEAMALYCGLKRTQFAATLRLHTGDSPVELINRLRVERARCLLRESSRSITEIAMNCGFDTSQYFARVFRALTGVSASEYRASPSSAQDRF